MTDDVRIRGSLERCVGEPAIGDSELRSLAARAWHERSIGVIFPDQVQNWRDRALLDLILNRLYGARNHNERGPRWQKQSDAARRSGRT